MMTKTFKQYLKYCSIGSKRKLHLRLPLFEHEIGESEPPELRNKNSTQLDGVITGSSLAGLPKEQTM